MYISLPWEYAQYNIEGSGSVGTMVKGRIGTIYLTIEWERNN